MVQVAARTKAVLMGVVGMWLLAGFGTLQRPPSCRFMRMSRKHVIEIAYYPPYSVLACYLCSPGLQHNLGTSQSIFTPLTSFSALPSRIQTIFLSHCRIKWFAPKGDRICSRPSMGLFGAACRPQEVLCHISQRKHGHLIGIQSG